MSVIEVKVPDIGDFSDVPVIAVMVAAGDTVAEEDPLVELESDKATMEVPSPAAGKVTEVVVKEGDNVSEGTVILKLEAGDAEAPVAPPSPEGVQEHEPAAPAADAGKRPAESAGTSTVDERAMDRAHASPSVRAFARELEIDLSKVQGSGRKGRILREDVTAYFKSTSEKAQAPPST